MAFLRVARLRIKRLRLLLVCVIPFPSFISTILVGLSWKVIPASLSWPWKIKFELHLLTNATFCRSIYPVLRDIDTFLTCSVHMILLTAVPKSMYIGRRSLKSFLLLQRCRKTHESRYQVSCVFSIAGD